MLPRVQNITSQGDVTAPEGTRATEGACAGRYLIVSLFLALLLYTNGINDRDLSARPGPCICSLYVYAYVQNFVLENIILTSEKITVTTAKGTLPCPKKDI